MREFKCCLKERFKSNIIPRLRAVVTGVTVVLSGKTRTVDEFWQAAVAIRLEEIRSSMD